MPVFRRMRSLSISLLLAVFLLILATMSMAGCACGPVRRSVPPHNGMASSVPAMMLCVPPPTPSPSQPITPTATAG